MREKRQRVEYMTLDLSPAWTLDGKKKHQEMMERLNELGKEGWILISGIEYLEHAVFMRIIEEE